MEVLVTGGAGYIGSVVVEQLLAAGAERVVVLDDLSTGHAAAVSAPATLVRGDIADASLVKRTIADHGLTSCIHMAAVALVGESVSDPAKYREVNVVRGQALLGAVLDAGVRRFVFSSTAATYGEPPRTPITEEMPTSPTNPYGESKLAFERALAAASARGLRSVALRYFNAAGATERNGEVHDPETHLIPIVLDVARGRRDAVPVFGEDWPTPDGSCVRDYVHVVDLARAHLLALGAIDAGDPFRVYNLGCGDGFSVKQVVDVARRVTGRPIATKSAPRRPGDPAILVASAAKIRRELGWSPSKASLEEIVGDAWRWVCARPDGY